MTCILYKDKLEYFRVDFLPVVVTGSLFPGESGLYTSISMVSRRSNSGSDALICEAFVGLLNRYSVSIMASHSLASTLPQLAHRAAGCIPARRYR